MTASLRVPRLVPRGVEELERRARALAAGGGEERAEAAGLRQVVEFTLGGSRCGLEAAGVERAVARLGRAISVPSADRTERAVAFVEERPLPLADLAGFAAGARRRAEELVGRPAIVIASAAGPVAVAVDGPLELAEEALSAAFAGDPGGDRVRTAGRLSGGATLLDAGWLADWAGRTARR